MGDMSTTTGRQTAGMRIRRAMPTVHTDDLAESRRLYVDTLGFHVAMEQPGFLMLKSPSVETTQVLLVARTGDLHDPAARLITMSVEVDDVDAAHAEALAQGLEIVRPLTDEPWGVRRFFVRSPDGSVVNVAQHVG